MPTFGESKLPEKNQTTIEIKPDNIDYINAGETPDIQLVDMPEKKERKKRQPRRTKEQAGEGVGEVWSLAHTLLAMLFDAEELELTPDEARELGIATVNLGAAYGMTIDEESKPIAITIFASKVAKIEKSKIKFIIDNGPQRKQKNRQETEQTAQQRHKEPRPIKIPQPSVSAEPMVVEYD